MRIVKNLQNFLLDQDYYIDLFKDTLHVYYYLDLISLSNTLIELKLKEFNLIIEGNNLTISAMDNHEILIKGTIDNMRFNR
ncbi:MAG: YabP/YqfC family sporulation protein [Ruminococcus sp.]|nr:YabP/YqfC family sporulation protein [Ruminococcus sp.]